MKKYLCCYAHKKEFVPRKTIIEIIVESTFSFSNMHRVIDVNNNHQKNMVMDAMRINQDGVG